MNQNLYDYFYSNLTRHDPHPAVDHALRAELMMDGRIGFYIHPHGRDGVTPNYTVDKDGTVTAKPNV